MKTLGMMGAVALIAMGLGAAPAAAWTGCGPKVMLGHTTGELSAGGPIGLSSTGEMPTIAAFCNVALGEYFVLGAEAGYGKMFGDLETVGINSEVYGLGRLGFQVGKNILPYAAVGYSRVDTDFGKFTGWQWGGGVDFKIPETAWSIDFRYLETTYDVGSISPALDATTRSAIIGFSYRFGQTEKPVKQVFDLGCDPKMANCK